MDGFTRYAIYFAPSGGLAKLGASWFGWDPEGARLDPLAGDVAWPDLPIDRRNLTATPSRYGLHGTLKPPFRLAEGREVAGLHNALSALAPRLSRLRLDGLRLKAVGSFLALVPEGDTTALGTLAGTLVEALDGHRAPPLTEELARRRASGLSARQEAMLLKWGYPYVMGEFRFHITLTGKIPDQRTRDVVAMRLAPLFEAEIETPFRIDDICLFGEGQDGRFRNLHRYPLTG
ncbi:MAG: DUF1045 domain-containing protein [Pseudomonadota bacterium]